MPTPTAGDVHVNQPLTNISVAWLLKNTTFVADKVFPVVPVEKQSDLYYLFDKSDFLRDEARPRADGSESAGGGFSLSTASYAATVKAFHKDIGDQMRANADSVLSLDRAATEFVTQKLAIARERQWMSTYFTTGVWGTDNTPSVLWSAGSTATPLENVETAKQTIKQNTGYIPNTLVLGSQVFSALRSNPQIKDQFKYTSADSIDVDMMARFFGVEKVLVSDAVYATNVEGAATTMAFMAGKNALLCYSADAPSLMQPTAGYTFAWSGYLGAVNGLRVKRFRMENLASDRVEGEMAYDMKIVAPEMGYFFNGCVA